MHNSVLEVATGEVYCLSVGVTFDVGIEGLLLLVHLLKELACLFMHVGVLEGGGDLLHDIARLRESVFVHNVSGACRKPAL